MSEYLKSIFCQKTFALHVPSSSDTHFLHYLMPLMRTTKPMSRWWMMPLVKSIPRSELDFSLWTVSDNFWYIPRVFLFQMGWSYEEVKRKSNILIHQAEMQKAKRYVNYSFVVVYSFWKITYLVHRDIIFQIKCLHKLCNFRKKISNG